MKVSLVSVTQPSKALRKLGVKTAEQLVSYVARVSNPSNQFNTETAPKLLAYCIRNHHWSIFETVSMTAEIETSRAIAAQILRHRSFTFQEFSQRYADVSEMGFEDIHPRRQDEKNRQSSTDDLETETREWFAAVRGNSEAAALDNYITALKYGIAKESARFLLPLSVRTRLYMTGSLRSWITYLQTRTDPSTQLEHREVALAIREIFNAEFPNVAQALEAK